jgi:ATP phosphoribosyltransferase
VAYALGFGKCRLSFAVSKNETFTGASFLSSKKIATSYPVLVQKYLNENKIQAEIHEISGSVEIAPGIGLADVICDLVSSGSTLFMNGLKEADTILDSQAVLIKRPALNADATAILERLMFRIESVKKAKKNKYVLLNAPNANLEKIISLLPGMKSPTVVALATPGWSSVHSVIAESDFWEIIEKLKLAGAEGILVVPIEKMIL